MSMNKQYLNAGRNSESDECLTPRYAVEPIVKYLKAKGYKNILCPFDTEDSHFVKVLQREGFDVTYSHIFPRENSDDSHTFSGENEEELHIMRRKDFFTYAKDAVKDIDCIVSNPPYSCKDEVITHLYNLEKPFMMLFPQNTLQGKYRTKLFMKYGLEYLGFTSRICFYTKNELDSLKTSNHFASGYFCKDVLPEKLIFEDLILENEPYYSKGNLFTK